ncbi:MAG: homoserine dehydrogenase [Lachnospiraceae bacterium]|nr:homoserine dehydrogenase [Lachnospiraceae bacterium]MEE3457428.1 homoserine dehydrogenase [Lachnospiraceae bacterium]
MVSAAIMGYGTVGAGVFKVLTMNRDVITGRVGEEIRVKYVLDLREFPGDPVMEVLTHDFNDILNDPEVKIVVETMGGLRPSYEFTKKALLAGKSVCTSNKELVAEHGVELREIAKEKNVNYLFEASCGGGIPIIHVLDSALTADEIDGVAGILNGTTNYILTQMMDEGQEFADALKDAQDLGYAERHPEADIEGWDACRKIAILSSLAYGKHISYKNVYTEGITNIDAVDMSYAKALKMKIRLLAASGRTEEGVWAMVAPMLVDRDNMLYHVNGVLNAVSVHGNAVGDTLFYGSGAGSLPTASAVAGDVISAARHLSRTLASDWKAEEMELMPLDDVRHAFFVRFAGTEEEAKAAFGEITPVCLPSLSGEFGFVTGVMTEKAFEEAASEKVIKRIRIA